MKKLLSSILLACACLHSGLGQGGPIFLMGIDAEDRNNLLEGHGPISLYASIASNILSQVRNGGSGILVMGGGTSANNEVLRFWRAIGESNRVAVTFVSGSNNIVSRSFAGFAMIGVASDIHETSSGGLTDAENLALAVRKTDMATHVNGGGGLLGFASLFDANAYGYLAEIGDFTFRENEFDLISPTLGGQALGITENNLDVHAWHQEYLTYPSFLSVLAYRTDTGNACVLGGGRVIVPLRLTCPAAVQINCAPPQGQAVTLTAGVRDEQGDRLTVVWTVNGAPVATNHIPSTAPNPNVANDTLTWPFVVGTHTVGVSVTDDLTPVKSCSTAVSLQTGTAPPTVLLADVVACAGSPVFLTPTVLGAAPYSYQWIRDDDVALPGATNATLGPITMPGGYSVRVCDRCGCTTSRRAAVSFSGGPQILQQPPAFLTACLGSPLSLSVLASDVVPLTYQWLFNGQPIIGSVSPAIVYASLQADHAGVYQVVVRGGSCAVTSAPSVLSAGGSPLDAEFTEGNAARWCAFASDGAAVSLSDDTAHVQSGRYSLRLNTASGFDTGVRFPCSPMAHWDLRTYEYLEFWCHAENPWPNGFQGSQPVIVLKTATGVFRYEPSDRLTTNNAWSYFRIPLAGNAIWRRTATNYPTLGDVNQIEIHQDTWDFGFTIYYDGVKFVRESECPRLRLEPPQPLGNDRYRLILSRADGVLFYSNSPPVVDLRSSESLALPWGAWSPVLPDISRLEGGRLAVDHTSLSTAQFYVASDRSALRFDVPATTNFGGLGTLPGKFVYPQGMCVGVGGELHVVDNTGQRVQVFDKDTMDFKRQYANGLFFPKDVAVNAAGVAYVSEYGDRIWVYAPDGSLLHNFTLRARAFPEGLFINPTSGDLVVAESPTEDSRISMWTPAGTLVRSWVPATGTYDVWVSGAGDVFCAAWGGIYRYSSTGVLLGQFTPRHFAGALCGDDAGILYVTYLDHESVDAYSIGGELQCTYEMMACSLEQPYSGFTLGVTCSGPNQLFVTDRATHKVIRLAIVRQRCSHCSP